MSWIPVEEQLPEIKEGRIFSDIVLGVRGDHYKLVELWQNKYGVIQWFGDWEPTHWQPLPKSPVSNETSPEPKSDAQKAMDETFYKAWETYGSELAGKPPKV